MDKWNVYFKAFSQPPVPEYPKGSLMSLNRLTELFCA